MNILKQRKGREAAMKKMMKALGFTAVALAEFALLAALIIVRDIPEGDDGRFQREWPRPWNWRHAETVRRLKAITMPEVYFYAPATMKDFVEYMSRATKDFDSPDIPLESRGITFVCADSVAAKTGPEKPKQETALIPCGGIGATTTAWDALTNVCTSVGCRFKVYPGKVEIGK